MFAKLAGEWGLTFSSGWWLTWSIWCLSSFLFFSFFMCCELAASCWVWVQLCNCISCSPRRTPCCFPSWLHLCTCRFSAITSATGSELVFQLGNRRRRAVHPLWTSAVVLHVLHFPSGCRAATRVSAHPSSWICGEPHFQPHLTQQSLSNSTHSGQLLGILFGLTDQALFSWKPLRWLLWNDWIYPAEQDPVKTVARHRRGSCEIL